MRRSDDQPSTGPADGTPAGRTDGTPALAQRRQARAGRTDGTPRAGRTDGTGARRAARRAHRRHAARRASGRHAAYWELCHGPWLRPPPGRGARSAGPAAWPPPRWPWPSR